jgi:hypothetical protein
MHQAPACPPLLSTGVRQTARVWASSGASRGLSRKLSCWIVVTSTGKLGLSTESEQKREQQNTELNDEDKPQPGDEGAFDRLMPKGVACPIGGRGATNTCEEQ